MPSPRKSPGRSNKRREAKPSNNKNDNNSKDPIVQEFPLHFENDDKGKVNILYFPLSVPDAANSIPSFHQDTPTLQVKPESRQLQLALGRRRFWGTAQDRLRTREYLAVVRDGVIHLKPIDAVYTMRPITTNATNSNNADNDNEEEEMGGEAKPVTIIKKRETEEQALARLSSYLHLKKKAEEEPWKVMRLVKK